MIEQCVYPRCSVSFRYLHKGKLFVLETDDDSSTVAPLADQPRKPRRLRPFWLCDACCRTMTVINEKGRGIRVIPLSSAGDERAAAS